jgi:hypothetical protein
MDRAASLRVQFTGNAQRSLFSEAPRQLTRRVSSQQSTVGGKRHSVIRRESIHQNQQRHSGYEFGATCNEVLVSKSQDARNHYEMLEAEFYAASPSCLASTGVAEARSGATLLNTCIANYDRCFRVCYNRKVLIPG